MPFELTIVTPEGEAFAGTVERVVLPGTEGEFGVLASHERFLSPLKIGQVEIQAADGPLYAAIRGGFAEVGGDQVTVLDDSCALSDDIDTSEADADYQAAKQALDRAAADDPGRYEHFEEALEHARNRLEVSRYTS